MKAIKSLILTGDGLNCENETAYALKKAGSETSIFTINEMISQDISLDDFDILALPGGFSFGDEISSAQILTLKIKQTILDQLTKFIQDKKPVIGICNGFQVLMKLNLLPNNESSTLLTLTQNDNAVFINKWSPMTLNKSHCLWTKDLPSDFYLPIRHGEGRLSYDPDFDSPTDHYEKMLKTGLVPLSYQHNENGSFENMAALCNEAGNVLGLMPHPEAALTNAQTPFDDLKGDYIGIEFFKNAVTYAQNRRDHATH
jgi:phosphoribosylformylglycinamidine synthase I